MLHYFVAFDPADGFLPNAVISDGLRHDSGRSASGVLYGTTVFGGANGAGTVFELTPPSSHGGAWTFTCTVSIRSRSSRAAPPEMATGPATGLISDASGALYGTTSQGGANGGGTVFQLTSAVSFVGIPGEPNCVGQSLSTLANSFGGISSAAVQFGYSNVQALEDAVQSYCAG